MLAEREVCDRTSFHSVFVQRRVVWPAGYERPTQFKKTVGFTGSERLLSLSL